MTANNSCRCAYPRCTCRTVETRCFNNTILGLEGKFGPLPSMCMSSHPFLESTSCSGNTQTTNLGLGNNKFSSLDPFVTSGCGCEVYVVLPPCTVLRFTYNEETEVYEGEAGYGLVYRNNEFSLVNDSGERWFFRGFAPDEPNPGRFTKGPAANGSRNSLEAFDPDNPGGDPYTASGSLKGLRVVETVDNIEITYAYVFEYNTDGNMTVATIKRKENSGAWENLHRVLFTYYSGGSSSSSSSSGGSGGGGDEYGSADDLQSVTEQVYVNSQWTGDRVSYFRYHLSVELATKRPPYFPPIDLPPDDDWEMPYEACCAWRGCGHLIRVDVICNGREIIYTCCRRHAQILPALQPPENFSGVPQFTHRGACEPLTFPPD